VSVLTLALVGALATNPHCGGAPKGSDLANRLVAIAQGESALDPLTIGVNADPRRDLPHTSLHLASPAEAAARARALIAEGRDIDLGLMGINTHYLGALTIETAFDGCANMREGAAHFGRDMRRVIYDLAHAHYNAGYGPQSLVHGAAYAASIERALPAIRVANDADPDVAVPQPAPHQPTEDEQDAASDEVRDLLHPTRRAPSPSRAHRDATPSDEGDHHQ
jgi:hypothetical protein